MCNPSPVNGCAVAQTLKAFNDIQFRFCKLKFHRMTSTAHFFFFYCVKDDGSTRKVMTRLSQKRWFSKVNNLTSPVGFVSGREDGEE